MHDRGLSVFQIIRTLYVELSEEWCSDGEDPEHLVAEVISRNRGR